MSSHLVSLLRSVPPGGTGWSEVPEKKVTAA